MMDFMDVMMWIAGGMVAGFFIWFIVLFIGLIEYW